METNELLKIWQTLAKEKLIDNELAKENIGRIIALSSSKTIEKLNGKLKSDLLMNAVTAIIIIAITVFATLFLHHRNQQLPVQGYIFLILVFSFYSIKALNLYSRVKLLNLSFNTSAILDSLQKIRSGLLKVSKKETIIVYLSIAFLTIYANILINDNTDFTHYNLNSLQGYVLLFSIGYLIALPWIGRFFFNRKFSGIISDIDKTIKELGSETK
jgi:hypothetical protein